MAERNIYLNLFAFILHLSSYARYARIQKSRKKNYRIGMGLTISTINLFKMFNLLGKLQSLNSRKMHELKK